jgi:hypothetical protein
MKTSLLPAAKLLWCLTIAVVLSNSSQAALTNVAWYRLGENDPGAARSPSPTSPTPPVLTGGKFSVTNPVAVPRQFFRLAK